MKVDFAARERRIDAWCDAVEVLIRPPDAVLAYVLTVVWIDPATGATDSHSSGRTKAVIPATVVEACQESVGGFLLQANTNQTPPQ